MNEETADVVGITCAWQEMKYHARFFGQQTEHIWNDANELKKNNFFEVKCKKKNQKNPHIYI